MKTRALAVPLLLAAALTLAGCTASANLTVPADQVAELAADALEAQLGQRPDIDCGDDDIALVDGEEVDCLLTDPETETEYDTVVTIEDVDGTKFSVDVQVADEPNGGSEPTEEEEPSAGDAPTVPGDDIATLAANALAPELGYTPTITCNEDVEIVVDNSVRCMIADEAGATATVLITITEFDGSTYKINAEVQ